MTLKSSPIEVDVDWVRRISFCLEGFSDLSSGGKKLFNARCPMCGDSKKNKRKKRLYIYENRGNLNVDCKNGCGGMSFYNFMKKAFAPEFEEYKRDVIKAKLGLKREMDKFRSEKLPEAPRIVEKDRVKELPGVVPVLSLESSHEAVEYLRNRGFTELEMERLMYAENFKIPAEFLSYKPLSERFDESPRIVIPFYDEEGYINVIQGRTLDPKSSLRYITIKNHEEAKKVYGLDRIDRSKTVYCVEGPLDSLFVDNCLASCDANLVRVEADVYIYDCQPRNKEIVAYMEAAIKAGKKVVVWPVSPDRKVDINDLIKGGISRTQIRKMIEDNTYDGLKARAKLRQWRKV